MTLETSGALSVSEVDPRVFKALDIKTQAVGKRRATTGATWSTSSLRIW